MKAIYPIHTMGSSRWWGQPALPESVEMPYFVEGTFATPMTLVCQINCAEFKQEHPDHQMAQLLPDKGLISCFAYLDYFFGDLDADSTGIHLGDWDEHTFQVIYSPDTSNLRLHEIMDEDGHECSIPAEAEQVPAEHHEESYMLKGPTLYEEEIEQEHPDYITLVQLDESDRHNLRFYDCGCLFFLIKPDDLQHLRFDQVKCCLYCM